MIKYSILKVLIPFLFSLTAVLNGRQQDLYINDISENGQRKLKIESNEDIYIHTDREEYIAGENCWFAAYLFERQNKNQPGRSNIAYIELLNSINNPVIQKRITLENGNGHGYFAIPDSLSSGRYMLRAYTNRMKNLSPEKCFNKIINIYNSFRSEVVYSKNTYRKVNSNGLNSENNPDTKQEIQQNIIPIMPKSIKPGESGLIISGFSSEVSKKRERITLDLLLDTSVIPSSENARISISVSSRPEDIKDAGISDYLFLMEENIKESLNDLPLPEYKFEEKGHLISCQLISKNDQDNKKDQVVVLGIPGKEAVFRYAITDEEGNFSFLLKNDGLPKDLVIQIVGNENNDNMIRIGSSFWDKYARNDTTNNPIFSSIPSYISDWSVNYQLAKIYGINSAGEPVPTTGRQIYSHGFYGKPELELIIADYILLPVMQEVFFELIPGVSMRTGKARYGITVSNPLNNKPYDAEATLMVDGIFIDDPSIIINMDPETVERIDVVRSEYVIGGYHFYGIINVITKSASFSSIPLSENAVRFRYNITDPHRPFISPDYSIPGNLNSRTPDFRNTLYWNPMVIPDKEGKARIEFWTSDYVSDYIINIQGMTSGGIPISVYKKLRVE